MVRLLPGSHNCDFVLHFQFALFPAGPANSDRAGAVQRADGFEPLPPAVSMPADGQLSALPSRSGARPTTRLKTDTDALVQVPTAAEDGQCAYGGVGWCTAERLRKQEISFDNDSTEHESIGAGEEERRASNDVGAFRARAQTTRFQCCSEQSPTATRTEWAQGWTTRAAGLGRDMDRKGR